MPNKSFSFSLNINKSLALSVLLHACFFILGLAMAAPQLAPLPLGVELMYGQGGTAPSVASTKSLKIPKMKAAVVAEDSAAPALKNDKVDEVASSLPATEKTAGSLAGTSDRGALQGREGVAHGQEVSPEERYLYEIKKLLERRKRYPAMAKKMGQTGIVTMRFTLAADGSLLASEVIEKSPYESLNQAAHELVRSINGVKPFPQEIQKTSWSFTVPIEYVLN
ncbi:MAG: siderophore-mediated iron transport protein [Bdellovibrio sp. ArHS]|uniref:energy transducer TonB n=1 Tax=Bdellovibrio sp. ArHS TaxID=1569284 RepID=UPI000582625A|nr:energy transducer TonB [Bdellovibrio sp. ArHS]KHD87617.1 MAG: siderophore-mediated iron transport protein [Bdellovibrio sp. ArHS]